MARSNFGPEVKAAMAEKPKPKQAAKKEPGPGDTPADMARDKKRGIVEGSPQDEAIDAAQAPQNLPSRPPAPGSVAQSSSVNPAHAAMAASIAHSILQHGR